MPWSDGLMVFDGSEGGSLMQINTTTGTATRIPCAQKALLPSIYDLVQDNTLGTDGIFMCCDFTRNALRRLVLPDAQAAIEQHYQGLRAKVDDCGAEISSLCSSLHNTISQAESAVHVCRTEVT